MFSFRITFNDTFKGEMVYKDEIIPLESFRLRNNMIRDKNKKEQYSIRHTDLVRLTLITSENKTLRLLCIFPKSGEMFRELEQVNDLTFYDNYISFDTTVIDRYNIK